jgi:hypothetical protein
MAMLTNITWGVFCERINRRLFNGWKSISENVTANEILLYAYEAIATVITRMSNEGLMLDGVRRIPEGFITTYRFTTFTKDQVTGKYTITLPAPPVNLELGYSIVEPYFAAGGNVSYPLVAVHPYQRSYYNKIATPNVGAFYYVENSVMYIDSNAVDLKNAGYTLCVPMLSPRSATGNDTDTMNLPDDAFNMVFDMVIEKLTGREAVPQNLVNDGVSTMHKQA